MSYLPVALDNMSNFDKITFFNEDMVSYVLDLLSQSLDGNKSNQDLVLKNFKISDILMLMINQNEYLNVAGKGCLVLSNLLWQNKAA